MSPERQKRSNINFRQTPKEFRSAKQAQTYEHLKRNMPYNLLDFTKERLDYAFTKIRGGVTKIFVKNLPEDAKRIK